MLLTNRAHLLYDALLTLVYPRACMICGRSVEQRSLGIACENCWQSTTIFSGGETVCWKCGAPCSGTVEESDRRNVRCHVCDGHEFTAARACGPYEHVLRETVLSLKRQPALPRYVLTLLTAVAQREPLNQSTSIVPVPLHPHRQKARGFNQALVIAQALSKTLCLPINEVSLRRTQHAEKYRAGLDARGRSETVTKAFDLIHAGLVKGEKVLLVDDVFTTGATAGACSKLLKDAAADEVFLLTIARTPH